MFRSDKEIEDFLKGSFDESLRETRDLFPDEMIDDDMPWAAENPAVQIGFTLRLPAPLHCKVKWLTTQIPKTSIHKICLIAVENSVNRLVDEVLKRDRG